MKIKFKNQICIGLLGFFITFNPSLSLSDSALNENILNCLKPMGHHLYVREVSCPLGNETFNSLGLGTYSTFGKHLDLQPVSYLQFPPPIAVCPSNGFVAYKEEFSDKELEDIKNYISSDEYKKIYQDKQASYYLFYKLTQNINIEEDVADWWLLLNASWEAEGCKDKEKYNLYVLEAIDKAIEALNGMTANDNKYFDLKILIPNLYRRIGNFNDAQVWLDKIDRSELPDNPQQKEGFLLAINLLDKAIQEKSTEKVQVRKEQKPKNPPKKLDKSTSPNDLLKKRRVNPDSGEQ